MPEPAPPKRPNAVGEKTTARISGSWQSHINLSSFLALLVTVAFVLPSMGLGRDDIKLYGDVAFSLLLVSGVAIAWRRGKLFVLSCGVGSAALAARWMNWFTPTPALHLWSVWWSLAAIVLIALVLLSQVFRDGPVTPARIEGAIAVYLLFGMGWAQCYDITEFLHPGSFSTATGHFQLSDWFYYSYVTLSTVGYGDITAVHPVARTLSVTEALTGQLYLAVLIARLVAMEVVSWQSRANRD
ncbi:MAG: potassium channel family protein [Candidatus Korobacteraceae bacterium]|jgi:hypothetical protein